MRTFKTLPQTVLAIMLASMVGVVACGGAPEPEPEPVEAPEAAAPDSSGTPAGLNPVSIPSENPMTPEKIALGHQLFFDERLSADGSRSCYSCHLNENGLTDGLPTAVGANERQLTRSSPSLWNVPYHAQFYWDGRSGSLAQAMAAWTGGNMGANADEVVAVLNGIEGYRCTSSNQSGPMGLFRKRDFLPVHRPARCA